jgi:hypothetical protein
MIFCSVVRLVVAPTADVDPESDLLTACFFPSNHFLKLLCSEILEDVLKKMFCSVLFYIERQQVCGKARPSLR